MILKFELYNEIQGSGEYSPLGLPAGQTGVGSIHSECLHQQVKLAAMVVE